MSTLAPSRGSQTTHLLEQPPTRNLDNRPPGPRPARPAPKSSEHVKRKRNPTMTTTLSPPTQTTTVRVPTTVDTTTRPTERLRSLLRDLRRRLRPVPGSVTPADYLDSVHYS